MLSRKTYDLTSKRIFRGVGSTRAVSLNGSRHDPCQRQNSGLKLFSLKSLFALGRTAAEVKADKLPVTQTHRREKVVIYRRDLLAHSACLLCVCVCVCASSNHCLSLDCKSVLNPKNKFHMFAQYLRSTVGINTSSQVMSQPAFLSYFVVYLDMFIQALPQLREHLRTPQPETDSTVFMVEVRVKLGKVTHLHLQVNL